MPASVVCIRKKPQPTKTRHKIVSNRNRSGTTQSLSSISFRWIIVKTDLSPSIRCSLYFFLKKRPFGLKTRARKRILYCSKNEQCHCEQEKKQKLRKKTKRLRGSQPDRDATQASSRPQLRTRLKPKHSAGAVGNTKYRFDQTYSIPDEMRSTR